MKIISYVEKDWTVSSLQATYRLPVLILQTLVNLQKSLFVLTNLNNQTFLAIQEL